MFGRGLPGLLAVLVAFSFGGFTCSVSGVTGFLLSVRQVVCSVPLYRLLWWPARVFISKSLDYSLPCRLVNAGLSEYKKNKKKIKNKKN